MNSFYCVYGLIVLTACVAAVADKYLFKKNANIAGAVAGYFAAFYYVVTAARTLLSGGSTYLSYSFYQKGVSAYAKVGILIVVTYVAYCLLRRFVEKFVRYIIGSFASLMLLVTVLLGYPKMTAVVIIGIVSVVIGLIILATDKTCFIKWFAEGNADRKTKVKTIGSRMLLFILLFVLEGPTELYAYNKGDFVYSYMSVATCIIPAAILMAAVSVTVLSFYVSGRMFDYVASACFVYSVLSFIQGMFLNGKMSTINGAGQSWSTFTIVINACIWVVLAITLLLIEYKLKKGRHIMNMAAIYLSAVQVITLVTVLLTTGVTSKDERALVKDDMFTLSGNKDVVVLLLDAYDTQMIDEVTKESSDYLSPLKDFTYYNNMSTRYDYTDGQLPLYMTGNDVAIDGDVDEYISKAYENAHFLEDIKNAGYDIRILTDRLYLQPSKDGVVDNFTLDYMCKLDVDKAVSQLSDCIRYKDMPFIFKPHYHYEAYSLTNIIADTDVYVMGLDYSFEDELLQSGIKLDGINGDSAFRFYHLYGAHSPYYLTEEATLDYNSTPMAQWKGTLKIAFDYLDALKQAGTYDDTTVIIMADHGFNDAQREAASEYGYEFTKNSNPIFMVKRAGESNNELQICDKPLKDTDICGTIMKCIDEKNASFGKAVWE
ncbi:MAG: hypothetical protein KBT19_03830 [Lachnospiraceae bacterium]|nr:hypothetical protein [Candidatus Colinaster equi]